MDKKILFIDDDKLILQSIKQLLNIKYKDVVADFESDVKKLISKIKNINYDIIVTDYQMPGLNGGTLLKKIKKKHPKIIGIILTGYMDEALKSKINDPDIFFLAKPYSIDDIMQTIEIALQAEH